MRKCRNLLSVLLLAVGCQAVSGGETGVVTADRLNVRLAPELKAPVIVRLNGGETVEVEKTAGQFYEIAAPRNTPVYVSGVYLRSGKTTAALKMHADMSNAAPVLGELPAGAEVRIVRETRYGWTQIEPPAGIRLYAAKLYIRLQKPLPAPTGAETGTEAAKPAPEAAPAPAAPEAEKPVPEAAPAPVKTETEAEKPVPEASAPAPEPPALPKEFLAELDALGVDPANGTPATATGCVLALGSTTTETVRHALLRQEGNRYVTEYFLASGTVKLDRFVERTIHAHGLVCKVPEWKTPLFVVLDAAEK